jgi:hypothetical protein
MTCPGCGSPVGRSAFLSAGGLSGIFCNSCGRELRSTYESRVRLTGGGIVLGMAVGGLARGVGAGSWAFPLALGAFAAWMWMRTEGLLRLEHVAMRSLRIGRSD